MSSCLSRGTGRAYGFDLENIVKSSSATSMRTSHSSSPSSNLSESSNSPMAVCTRKPRTQRKRPNQTYNEAAALLSTACPTIFSINKNNNNQSTLPNQRSYFFNEPPQLILPFPVTERPIKMKPSSSIELKDRSPIDSNSNSMEPSEGYQENFDTDSMLDEEIEAGIDSIMGKSNSIVGGDEISNAKSCFSFNFDFNYNTCYGYPMGLGFGGNLEFNFGLGLRNGVRALRNVDERNWWSFPAVNVMCISPPDSVKLKKAPTEKKKKVEESMKMELELGNPIPGERNLSLENWPRLLLKLNYEKVLNAWSDKGSPLPEEMSGSESPGSDIHARLAQIDLFSDNGGLREASVTRYKEKRRTRLFSKKIRYQVRKLNADQRPRSKGRFVRRPNSPTCEKP
ncbi:protein CHLOROPLAST IMPORT APPARATUS 2 [Lactuca sativa]|uniref:protein CHLOROPLAST IMPORT APPARATUS 2 n=1 Tax=Lactuca sativa TaxID=4236 RepID=UPI000CD9C1FC|nr:protein CHLOROPLAST IMPORT APPARATUS 2 [Lactuca sativa]